MKTLTTYQEMQLRSVYFTGDFQYKTEQGTKVSRKAWQQMIDTLMDAGFIKYTERGKRVTAAGKAYMEARH